ncbi:MAG: protein kinase [Acidobacteria bacterium]|nr:protein kinase [Acidobacteriota bacterium]
MNVRLDREIKRVFDSLVELPADQQLATLAALDPQVRRGVEQLLSFDSPADGFLLPLPERLGLREAAEEEVLTPIAPGTLLNNRYLVERYYRSGGFSTIYLARDQRLWNKQVVVKALDRLKGASLETGLDSEIRALSQLNHPSIVSLYDYGWLDSGIPFLVMPYVPGLTLAEAVEAEGIQPQRALAILREVALAIGAAHQQGVWHLDIKPQNVMLSEPGTTGEKISLVDFGIARVRESAGGLRAGSADYMAPEQQRGVPCAQSDIFSLAVLGCFILTGRPIRAPHEASAELTGIPTAARDALVQALAEDPDHRRPSTGEAFAAALASGRPWWQQTWVAGLGAVALAVLLMGIRLFEALHQPTPAVHQEPLPFTHEAGVEQYPAFSPDGQLVYYSAGGDEKADIWVKSEGGPPRRLTSGGHGDIKPAISSDGHRVAFLRNHGSPAMDLMVMNADGSGIQMVLERQPFRNVEWGPQDRMLIYTVGLQSPGGQNLNQVRAVDLATKQSWEIMPAPAGSRGDIDPRYSQVRQALVFSRYETRESSDLWVQPLTTQGRSAGAPWRLTFEHQRVGWPNWTPDGKEVIYLSGTLARKSIRRVAATPTAVPRTASAISTGEIAMPRDAWKLAFVRETSDVNLGLLRRRGAAWEDAGVVAASSFTDEEPRISPDGRMVAYVSDRSGREQVWLAPLAGAQSTPAEPPRQITFLDRSDTLFVCWMPDGEQLMISTRDAVQGASTFLVPRTGGLVRQVSQETGVAAGHDGRSIYVRSDRTGRPEIWRLQLDSGATTQVTRGGSTGGVESPDGRYFYFNRTQNDLGIWRVPAAGGPEEQIVKEPLARRTLYAVTNSGIYYIAGGKPAELRYRPLNATRSTPLLTIAKTLFWGFDVSLDEKLMVFSEYDVENTDIMLISDFR